MESAKTHVVRDAQQRDRVVGYHALAGASIRHEDATRKVAHGMPKHPIPAILLARLAVDVSVKQRGLGAWLLTDAAKRALAAAEAVGIRVMLVHALDDDAARFYGRFGFLPSPTDPMNLQRKMADLRASVEVAASDR